MALRTRSRGPTFDKLVVGSKGIGGVYAYTDYNGVRYYAPYHTLLQRYLADLVFSKSTATTWNNEGSTITDEEPTPDKTRWNYCKHTKIKYATGTYGYVMHTGTTTKRYYISAARYPPPLVLAADRPVLTDLQLHQLRALSYQKLVPEFKNPDDFSGLNFLWEMKDLKGALKLTSRGVSSIAKHWRDVFQGMTSSKKVVRQVASQTLAYDFALKPLVKDCAALLNTYENARIALDQFNSMGKVKQTFRSSVPLVVQSSTVSSGGFTTLTWKAHVFRAQVEGTYHLSDGVLDDLGGIPEFLGLRATWGKLWDMVPLSFVVDWFFSVGKALDSLDTKARAKLQVQRYSESYTSEYWKVVYRTPVYSSYIYDEMVSHFDPPQDFIYEKYIKPLIPETTKVIAISRCSSYERVPMRWPGYADPFHHVILPELRWPLANLQQEHKFQRMRDGLAMLSQVWSR